MLSAAAQRKRSTYAAAPNTENLLGEVVPFVVSSSGVIEEDGRGWLNRLARPALAAMDAVEKRRWRFYWFSLLAEACAKDQAGQLLSQTAHFEATAARERTDAGGS